MPCSEPSALDIVALRAVETADRAGTLWTDEDRTWASRAGAEVVGAVATPESFLATRARLGLERLATRATPVVRAVAALRWRPWVGTTVVLTAAVAGIAVDIVGSTQRINLLAPPFFGVLAWNVLVYAMLLVGAIVRYGDAGAPGLARRALIRIAGGHPSGGRGVPGAAIAGLIADWAKVAGPLYAVRAGRILHVAAAAFAAGLVAGLYARGLAFEFRASWESTFLDATTVQGLLAAALAPGAALTGIPVPSLADLEALRAPASGNAARWLHLMAATVLLLVIGPRLALAAWSGSLERYRRSHVALPLDEPYFARLLRGFRGGPARVRVVPYSYTPDSTATAALERLVRTLFGGSAALTVVAPVPYGGEDALASAPPPGIAGAVDGADTTVIALFSANATPEAATHGAFLAAWRTRLGSGATLLALIDDGPWRARWPDDPARLDARTAAWEALAVDLGVRCAVAPLTDDGHEQAVAATEAALQGDEAD